jgi:hypothetical protein
LHLLASPAVVSKQSSSRGAPYQREEVVRCKSNEMRLVV